MARSKRAKVVPLTQAKKKLRSDKEHTVQLARSEAAAGVQLQQPPR